VGKALALPETTETLHPLAAELLQALPKARLDSHKRADLRVPTLPEVNASKALADRIARAFHVILNAVEPLGISYRKSQGSYNDGFFLRRHDRLYLRIEETLVDLDGKTRRVPSWDWQARNTRLSGQLCFTLKTAHYGGGEPKEWIESNKLPLEKLLAQIVAFIRQHYLDAHNRRIQEAIEQEKRHMEWERRQREWEAKEAIRVQQERERKHNEALSSAKKTREEDLLKAAERWRLNRSVLQFIDECEQRWRNSSAALSAEQEAWLAWARHIASTLSPFEAGYPDPTRDGGFDATTVLFGGPYPLTRHFPPPPTMLKLPPPVATATHTTPDSVT
jgi:hypothetical protein